MMRLRPSLLLAFALIAPPSALRANQPDQQPDESTIERRVRDLERGLHEAPVVQPEPDARRRPDTLRPGPGTLVREGTILANRRGRMAPLDGGWVYVFDSDSEGRAEPTMTLLPCLRLAEMRRLAEGRHESLTLVTTGQVFVYRQRNYLLPTYFTTYAAEPAASQPPASDAPASTDRAAAPKDPDPAVGDLLSRMQSPRRAEPPPSRAGGAPTPLELQDAGRAPGLMREGQTMVARKGRVLRGPGSVLVFADDTGPARADHPTPVLPLLPNLNLERFESLVSDQPSGVPLTISGQVFVYEEANYLLVTLFRLERDREGNLIPAQ